jgi:type II restriction enzyme
MKSDFEKWLTLMKESIATWDYYTDFNKVYKNVEKIKLELNIKMLKKIL